MDDGGGESRCAKGAQFVANFVVAPDDEAAFATLDSVFFGERGATAVTSGGEAGGFLPIAHVEGVAEFKGGQQGLRRRGGVQREPVACGLATRDEALIAFGFREQVGFQRVLMLNALKFAVVALRLSNGSLVVCHQEGAAGSRVEEVGGQSLHCAAAGVKIRFHGGGGHGEGQASKFEREGCQVAAGRGALEQFGEKCVSEGSLNAGEGGGVAVGHALDKLPLHLKGLLHATKR